MYDEHRNRVYHGPGTAEQDENRLTCQVCGFPGISPYAEPGQSMAPEGAVRITVSGSTYVWSSPIEPVTGLDKEVVVQPSGLQACPDCGAERFLDGQRGSAHAVRMR